MASSKKYIRITCATCGKETEKRSDFVANNIRDGRKLVCSRACAVPHRKPSVYKPILIDEYLQSNRTSICMMCNEEKAITSFIKDVKGKHKKFRKSFFCEVCRPLRRKEYYLRAKYQDMSVERLDAMLLNQKGLCSICNKDMTRPCVDHNHSTDKVRDLLCVQCNAMLGNAMEDVDILSNAIDYLRRHG